MLRNFGNRNMYFIYYYKFYKFRTKFLYSCRKEMRIMFFNRFLINELISVILKFKSSTSVNSRCFLTYRSRFVYKIFKFSRHTLREYARYGKVFALAKV